MGEKDNETYSYEETVEWHERALKRMLRTPHEQKVIRSERGSDVGLPATYAQPSFKIIGGPQLFPEDQYSRVAGSK